jgi:HAD superfamily hydrolase (TIGR01450 family)
VNAVILAAGVGSRLRPLTDEKPKTMVEVNGVPMLGRIIGLLLRRPIQQVVVCTGYRADAITSYCGEAFPSERVTFVHNELFDATNNMYSLYLAREYLRGGGLLMNADLCFDEAVIDVLLGQEGSAFAVDVGVYNDESMKVTAADGLVTAIAKTIGPDEALGCSIDVYKFDGEGGALLVAEVEHVVEQERNLNDWTEVALDSLCRGGRLKPHAADVHGLRWAEIDNFDDLLDAELAFNERWDELRRRSVFFLDKDGTLALGARPLRGAVELTSWLGRRSDKEYFVLTNNSSRTPSAHVDGLRGSGLDVEQRNVIVSTDAAARWLVQEGHNRVFWLATSDVGDDLEQRHGLRFDEEQPAAVLLTYDTTLTYDKLARAVRFLREGLPYFATHRDLVCPTEDGPIPDIGTFIELIRLTTGREPDMTFGKPDTLIIDGALESLGKSYDDAVVVGDRLYTDVALKDGTAMLSVLVLSGETDRVAYERQDRRADIVVRDVAVLLEKLSSPV